MGGGADLASGVHSLPAGRSPRGRRSHQRCNDERFDVGSIRDPAYEQHSSRTGVHPHMLRHACGYKLANDGRDTRALQHYLGHKIIMHTVRYVLA